MRLLALSIIQQLSSLWQKKQAINVCEASECSSAFSVMCSPFASVYDHSQFERTLPTSDKSGRSLKWLLSKAEFQATRMMASLFVLPIMSKAMSLQRYWGSHFKMRGSEIFGGKQLFSGHMTMGLSRNSACLKINNRQKQCYPSEFCLGNRANGRIIEMLRLFSSNLHPVCELMGSRGGTRS